MYCSSVFDDVSVMVYVQFPCVGLVCLLSCKFSSPVPDWRVRNRICTVTICRNDVSVSVLLHCVRLACLSSCTYSSSVLDLHVCKHLCTVPVV